MTAHSPEYSHSSHIRRVQDAARAAGIKGAAFAVLAYMCQSADFKKPTVRVAKATICDRCGYHWDTVRLALRTLRAVGLIRPVAYETGGRHMATVYVLQTGNGAENAPPFGGADMEKRGGISVEKGAENPAERGRKIRPPSTDHSYDPSRRKGAASSGGRASGGLDVAASGNTPPDRRSAEEARLFAEDHRLHGLTVAIERAKARAAERSQDA